MTRYKQAAICILQMVAFLFCAHFAPILRPIGQNILCSAQEFRPSSFEPRFMLPQSQPDKALAQTGCPFTTQSRYLFFEYLQLCFLLSIFPATSMAFLHGPSARFFPQHGGGFRVSPQTLADASVFFRQCSIGPDMYAAGHNTNSFSIIEARQSLLPNKT